MDNFYINSIIDQNLICKKNNTVFYESNENSILGISQDVKFNIYPIHGLRHLPESDTNGWYIWANEYSLDDDFFEPIHTFHLSNIKPQIIKYLGLPPGWRFIYAPDYEDVWFDENLLIS